jgi:Ca-activated chloride channel family protein
MPTPAPPTSGRALSALPLLAVSAHGRLDGLLFELAVEQRYCNRGERAIEAVFTFPVPSRAALLELALQLGERRLEAVVTERRGATEQYERALEAGDTAVLLESAGNGLYTLSVGNLLPGETAWIRYRHAELLDANRGLIRLQVPTVIAPRYGNPAEAGLHGPAIPGVDPLVEYPFSIEIDLVGVRHDTQLDSPTHSIRVRQSEAGTHVSLAKAALLDRDFVLEVPEATLPREALVARDGEQWVAVASTALEEVSAEHRPLALTVILDCSGSMQGDSIEAARRAVARVIDGLDAEDRIGVLRFGSTTQWMTEGLRPCTREHLSALRAAIGTIAADLGGTEMAQALTEALRTSMAEGRGGDLLLVTDGQVQELERLVGLVAASGRRLFVVAVGAAPNEGLARRLAEATGGACEFVSGGELAEAAIVRMARRLRAEPRAVRAVQWPQAPIWSGPSPTAVFPGETVHLLAGFAVPPAGSLQLELATADGSLHVIECRIGSSEFPSTTLARIAAARRLTHLSPVEATALAVRHQIACAFTSFVVVAERSEAEKSAAMPATIAVPQMLAAGWAGAGRVLGQPLRAELGIGSTTIRRGAPRALPAGASVPEDHAALLLSLMEPKKLFRPVAAPIVAASNPRNILAWLAQHPRLTRISALSAAGIDPRLMGRLVELHREWGCSEPDFIDLLIEALIAIVGDGSAEAQFIRRVRKPVGASFFGARKRSARRRAVMALLLSEAGS